MAHLLGCLHRSKKAGDSRRPGSFGHCKRAGKSATNSKTLLDKDKRSRRTSFE